jgi:hypothetical protein
MKRKLIEIKHINSPVFFKNSPALVMASARIDGRAIELDQDDCVVEIGSGRQQKLEDLGVTPGKRYFIINVDRYRHNWEAIWSRDNLKSHQKDKKACQGCEHSFGHKHYKKWAFQYCRDCGDGLNIVASFVVNDSYIAEFGETGD